MDDDPTMLRMIELYLNDFPVRLMFVRNGRTALHKLEDEKVDLLLTDLQMPEIDGLSLIKKLRSQDKTMPIVVLSAFGMEKMVEKAMELGANEMITKPFDSRTLKNTLKKQLHIA